MDQIYKDRLLLLADKLDKLPPERFDFARWVGNDWKGLPDLCGTTACGMGLATTIPEFQALGLHMHISTQFDDRTYSGFPCMVGDSGEFKYNGVRTVGPAERAGLAVFGLDCDSFNYLFIPRDDIGNDVRENILSRFRKEGLPETATAQELADHIRYFVSIS